MEKIYSKLGRLPDLRRVADFLQDFTGFIRVEEGMLFYLDSRLIVSLWRDDPVDIRDIFKRLPEEFLIEVYRCSREELREILKERLGEDIFKVEEESPLISVPLDSYNSIYHHIDDGSYEVTLIPKRFCSDRGIIVFKDREEVLALYHTRDKTLEGIRALGKIRAVFAVSEMKGFIREISKEEMEEYMRKYPQGVLKRFISLEELIERIRSKGPSKVIHNHSLMDVLSEEPSLLEIDGKMYIVSRDRKPVYAFFDKYRGDKAYRYIKNYCLFRDVEIRVYPLSREEYRIFRDFKDIMLG